MKYGLWLSALGAVFFCGCLNHAMGIAGTWQSDGDRPWKIVLDGDGTISEVFRPDGMHIVPAEGGVVPEPTSDVYTHYIFGPCTWSYDKETNTLRVVIMVDDFYVRTEEIELGCKIADEVEGPLSADSKSWTADWRTFTDCDTPRHIVEQTVTRDKIIFKKIQ